MNSGIAVSSKKCTIFIGIRKTELVSNFGCALELFFKNDTILEKTSADIC